VRYFFRVEFDGTNYAGWQIQPGEKTVQGALNDACRVLTRQSCSVVGAGRTDAGVHARRMGCHVDIDGENLESQNTIRSLNGLLPADIAVSEFRPVSDLCHARYSACMRSYRYYFTEQKKPLWQGRVWDIRKYTIDWDLFSEEMKLLHGTHDCSAFCAAGTETVNMECDISFVSLEKNNDDLYVFTIQANRFVYRMVRSIVGTLIDISRGYKTKVSIEDILKSGNRKNIGVVAPAAGLVLDDVIYPEEFGV